MKERPILFSAPMVRAILDGRKTQTRRAVKIMELARGEARGVRVAPNTFCYVDFDGVPGLSWRPFAGSPTVPLPADKVASACPYGAPGDRLWVRETWAVSAEWSRFAPSQLGQMTKRPPVRYPATLAVERAYDGWCDRFRPSIHMPRWASRITLDVTGVRVERLQDISEEDAVAEGVEQVRLGSRMVWRGYAALAEGRTGCRLSARESFESLWASINGDESWFANPWVWVVEFKRVTP